MNRITGIVLALVLIAVSAAVFYHPDMMVSPGKLITAHQSLDGDCFACHAPLHGASNERCTGCHKPDNIGKLTTEGKLLQKATATVPFHNKLLTQDCMACHTDHIGTTGRKTSVQFQHDMLPDDTRNQCQSCHTPPADTLHVTMRDNCNQCHSQQQWKPATFKHDNFFVLDEHHNAECETCHVKSNFKQFTCYGCHEHTPAKIRSEHLEEGIQNFENCTECHRSGNEHDVRGRRHANGEND
jgi:hypothetical protein